MRSDQSLLYCTVLDYTARIDRNALFSVFMCRLDEGSSIVYTTIAFAYKLLRWLASGYSFVVLCCVSVTPSPLLIEAPLVTLYT